MTMDVSGQVIVSSEHVEQTALRRRAFSAVLLLVVVLMATHAYARGPVLVSLDYETDPALAECPSAADFRREIVRQLGRDPFRDSAPRRMVVRLFSTESRMGGRVEWRDANDQWQGERTFSSRNESCAQMARAMALATAIQIQLLASPDEGSPAKSPADSNPPVPAVGDGKPAVPPPVPAIGVAAPREPRIAVDVGVGVIHDFGDSPDLVLPRIALWWGRPAAIDLRLTVSGLGPGAEVAGPEGVAQIDRFVMTLELVQFFRPGRTVQPLLAVGGGWQDVRVRGTSAMPSLAAARQGQVFSGLLSASGGLAFELAKRLFAIVEVETLLFRPSVTVQIGSARAATADGAALFVHGGLLARF
jgi:hypothetical protein